MSKASAARQAAEQAEPVVQTPAPAKPVPHPADKLTRQQKAAAVIVSLGADKASQLYQYMDRRTGGHHGRCSGAAGGRDQRHYAVGAADGVCESGAPENDRQGGGWV